MSVLLTPSGWTRFDAGHEVIFELASPGGTERVRCHTGQAPLRPMRQIVQSVLSDVGCTAESPLHIERLFTAEGELLALCEVSCQRGSEPAFVNVGVVFAEESYLLGMAIWKDSEQVGKLRPVLRELLMRSSLGLGLRRRRFYHAMPEGWQGLASGLLTRYYPQTYPQELSCLTVFPANPVEALPAAVFAAWLTDEQAAGFQVAACSPAQAFSTPAGLVGQRHWLHGTYDRPSDSAAVKEVWRTLCIARAGSYLYSFLLDCAESAQRDHHQPMLSALIDSVEPIPSSKPHGQGPAVPSLQWAD